MLTAFNISLLIAWFFSASADYSEFCHLWQMKEYRIDRMRDFFTTRQGKFFWLKYNIFLRSLIALGLFFLFNDYVLVGKIFLLLLLSFDILRSFAIFQRHTFRRPKITAKVTTILLTAVAVEGVVIFFSRDWLIIFLLLVARWYIVSGIILLTALPIRLMKKRYIKLATKKLANYPNLKVIGITGSFGKTSVKTFLSHLLSAKFKVLSTPKNTNTDIGIAQFILNQDFSNAEVFIVEMGAYHIGEIKVIADMVQPCIGILTAINEQHVSLFGGIKNTQQAKYELLRSLSASGLAVTNSDNLYCREFLSELTARVKTFGYDDKYNPDICIKTAESTLTGISCQYKIGNGALALQAPVLGAHNCDNLAACVWVARELGLTDDDILGQCRTLQLPERTLEKYRYGSCTVLDDSYNSNPDGFKSALQVLTTFPSNMKRIVITRGMLELGERSLELHEKIAGEMAFVVDQLIVISSDALAGFTAGIDKKYGTEIILKDNPDDLLAFVKQLKVTNSLVLLENRIPEIVYKEITSASNL